MHSNPQRLEGDISVLRFEEASRNSLQEYCGGLRTDNQHGQGSYRCERDASTKFVYDGHFYVNHFEGYGKLQLDDGTSFHGLFRTSRRFGPGVMTYASGKQDVGYWQGQHLMRLLKTLDGHVVPKLARSHYAILQLFNKFARRDPTDHAGKCKFNRSIRNEHSVFFHKPYYDVCLREPSASHCTDDTTNDVMVRNNDPFYVDVIEHMKRHRYGEATALSAIRNNERNAFQSPGVHEKACLYFLACCASGECSTMTVTRRTYNVNPNVCDCSGNAGVMYASVGDHCTVLRALSALGANLNATNDEGLTALNMCLLRYIATVTGIDDWEAAFLPIAERKTASKLLKNVSNQSKKAQAYHFGLGPTTASRTARLRRADGCEVSCSKIALTIETLLSLGADPCNCSVPQPSFILGLYCNNSTLLKSLLRGMDINATFGTDRLSLLHILCSLPESECASELCDVLIQHNINIRSRTHSTHWESERSSVIAGSGTPDDEGKTALHILAMRKDFGDALEGSMNPVAHLIGSAHRDALSDTYLGHTPLSLAVLRGNVQLVQVLLDCRADPNQRLECGLGNALTVYGLKRYNTGASTAISRDHATCTRILNLLLRYWANPVLPVGDCGNAFEFCQSERQKSLKDNHLRFQNHISNQLLRATRLAILRNIQGRVFFILLQKMLEEDVQNYTHIAKYLHTNDVLRIVRLCCQRRILDLSNVEHFLSINILFEFVKIFGKQSTSKSRVKISKQANGEVVKNDDVSLPNIGYGAADKIVEFELDLHDNAKYQTCFNCGIRTHKTLRACPTCGLMYYCSEACNLADNNSNTPHVCRILFYNNEQVRFAADDTYRNVAEVEALTANLPSLSSFKHCHPARSLSKPPSSGNVSTRQSVTIRANRKSAIDDKARPIINRKHDSTIQNKMAGITKEHKSRQASRLRAPELNQEFRDALSKLFPQHDFGEVLVSPFVCCSDSQFYYRFSKQRPEFMNTHM